MCDETDDYETCGGTTEPFPTTSSTSTNSTTISTARQIQENILLDYTLPQQPGSNTSSSSAGYSPVKKFDLNLAPLETKAGRFIPPYSIYVGNGIILQITKFKTDYYVCFGKEEEDGAVKSRINIPIRYMEPLRRAVVAMEAHVNKNH